MWLIVGLGNPGKTYANTRHNLGFLVIDILASNFSIPLQKKTKYFSIGTGSIDGSEVVLVKPLTFMNRSGLAVREVLLMYQEIDNILVVHDDLDLDTGTIRIRKSGSSGGHRGIESIIETLGTKSFLRLKIGIGRPEKMHSEDYVLTSFPKKEKAIVKNTLEKAVKAIETILAKGISQAQNEFHRE
jgi:PTH1 family peptidyl-tRNA hydrolase